MSFEQEALVETPRTTPWDTVAMDLDPWPITLQDVRTYLQAAGEEERELIRTELVPDTWEATTQFAMCPGRRSYPKSTRLP